MKVTLSFEKTVSEDISIMVDALRASSTITLALDKFEKIIPCLSAEEAVKIARNVSEVSEAIKQFKSTTQAIDEQK